MNFISRPFKTSRQILRASISTILALGALSSAAHAATKIWDGGVGGTGTDLATAANWDLDALPAANDTLQWNGTAPGDLFLTVTGSAAFAGGNGYSIDVTSAQTGALQIDNVTSNTSANAFRLQNITIASGAGAFTLGDGNGTSIFTLGAGTTNNLNTWTNNSSNTATIASDAIFANGGGLANRVLTLTGSGNWNMNAPFGVTVSGGSGTFALTKAGTGTLTLSAANTYTGGTTLSGGKLVLAHTGALGASSQLNFGAAAGTTVEFATDTPVANAIATNSSTGFSTTIILNRATAGAAYTQTLGAATYGGGTINVQAGANVTSGTPTLFYNSVGLTSGTAGSTALFNPTAANITINSASITGTANAKNLGLGGTSAGNLVTGAITNGLAGATLSVVKSDSSTWTLTGANTYTGATTVNGGTLITTTAQTGATTVTVADGATFGVKLASAGSTFNVGTLTMGAATGSTLLLDTGAFGNPTVPIISATTFTPAAPTTLRVSGGMLTIGSIIPLIDYTGTIGGGGFGGLSLVLPSRTVGNLVDNTTDTRVDLNITGLEQIKWKGNVSGNWDADTDGTGTNGTQNWVTTVTNTPTKYLQGTGGTDTVNFDDSATGTTDINIAISVAPSGTNFNNSTKNYTVASTGGFGIGGTGVLAKSGSGSLTLNTANTYSGGTVLNAGTLNVNNASALGSGTLTINGGTLDAAGATVLSTNNAQNWNGDFSFAGTSDLDMGSGTVTLGGTGTSRTVTIPNFVMLTVGELQSATHGLNKLGAGTLAVSSVGTGAAGSVIAGPLNLGEGTLQINRSGAAAGVSGDFTAGGLTGSGTVTNGAAVERWLYVNTAGSFDFAGTLMNGGSGALGFNKQGTGTQTLSGSSFYTGATTVGGGTLNLTGSLTGTIITVASGATFSESSTGVIGGGGALTVEGTATLAGANSYTGKTTINGGGVITASSLNSVATPSPTSSLGAPSTVANGTIDMTGGGGNGTLIYTGTGETTDRVINLAAGANAGLSAILDQSGTGLLKFTSNFTVTGAQTHTLVLQGSTTGAGEIAGAIVNNSATNFTSLTKRGTGTWTLSGANTYTGPTVVEAGTLITTTAQTGATSVTVADGATFGVRQTTAGSSFNVGTLTTGTGTGSTLIFDTGVFGNPTAPVISATNLTLNAPVLLKVNGSMLSAGTNIPLLDYTGTIGGVGFAGLSVALPVRTMGNLVDNTTDTRVDLNITGLEQIKWKGNVNGNWDADINGTGATGTQNWLTTVTNTPTKYLQGTGGTDTVNFDDSATGTTSINIAMAVTPNGTNFNNSAKNYTVSSTGSFGIGGTGALTKSGTGNVTLNTANAYSGGTVLNAGTLVIGDASAIGTGALTINGGTLDATSTTVLSTNNAQNWNGDFAFRGGSDLDMGSATVTLGGTGTTRAVTINELSLSVGEIKSAALGLNKQGVGTLVVGSVGDGANGSVIAGPLNAGQGTLQINRTGTAAATSGDFTVGGLTGTGTVVNGAFVERWLFVNTTGTFDFAGTLDNGIGGALGFNKQGTGTQTLSGTNNYTGATTVGGGTLILQGTNSSFGTNATVNAGNLVLANTSSLGSTSLIRLAGNNVSTLTFATDSDDGTIYNFTQGTTTNSTIVSDRATPGVGINHTLTTQTGANGVGGGSITFASGPNVTSGTGRITFPYFGLGAGSVQTTVLNPTTANVTVGDISKANNNFSQTIELGGTSQDNEVTGVISNGFALSGANAVSLTKSGTSTWRLSGANTYTGATTINGGELIVSGGLNGTSSVSVAAGATLSGNSSIVTGANGNATLAAGSFLEPGNGTTGNIGTLDFSIVTGVLDLAAATTNTGSLKFDLAAPGVSDLITLSTGVLNIGTDALGFSDFAFNATAGFAQGTYTLFNSFSPITGTLDAADLSGTIALGLIGTLGFADNGNDIVLRVVPEPSSAALLLSAAAGLLGLRRGRRRAVK